MKVLGSVAYPKAVINDQTGRVTPAAAKMWEKLGSDPHFRKEGQKLFARDESYLNKYKEQFLLEEEKILVEEEADSLLRRRMRDIYGSHNSS